LPKGPCPTRIHYVCILFQTDFGHSRPLESTDMILKLQTAGRYSRNIQTSVYFLIYKDTITVCPTSGTTLLYRVRQSHVQKYNRTTLTAFPASKCRKLSSLAVSTGRENPPVSLSWSTLFYENMWPYTLQNASS